VREPAAKTLLEHSEFLRALARSILRDNHAAEDVAQDALLAAGRRPGVRAWLGTVARNLAVSRLRGDRRRARRERAAARPEAHGDVPEAVARLEAQQRVVEAVLALEPHYREVVLERFFYERSLPDVAARLGVPVATARTRLRRALATLKARLERRLGPAALVAALTLLAGPVEAGFAGVILMSTKTKVAAALVLIAAAAWMLVSSRTRPPAEERGAAGRPEAVRTADAPVVAPSEAPRAQVPGPLVAGRCVDSRAATPIEGACVRIGAGEATTDAAGRFAAPWPAGSCAPALVASKEGYADGVAALPGDRGDIDLGEIRMRPLLVLRGTVVTPDGAPAKGAVVVLREDNDLYGRLDISTTADDAGRFTLPLPDRMTAPGPVRDTVPVLVAAHLPGFVEGKSAVDDPDAELHVRLGRARAVRGAVVDETTGEGVPGAELFITPFKLFLGNGWRAAVSGPDGSFEAWIRPLPDREGLIVPGMDVRAKGYVPRHLAPSDLAADGNRIALAPSAIVRGRVAHVDGRPAAGVEVTSVGLVPRRQPSSPAMAERERRYWGDNPPRFDVASPIDTRTRSDDAGEFAVEVPRTPPFRISAAAWTLAAEMDLTELPDEPLVLTLRVLDGHGLFPVRVVDPERRPIAGAAVTWWAVPGAAGEGMDRSAATEARTGVDGCADVWTSAGWTKPVLLVAWAPGWFGVSREPVDRQRLVGAAEVVCEPAGIIRGRVVGAPLHYGARASLWWRVAGEIPWRVQLVRIAKDGRFELPGAPPGRSVLVVAEPRGRSLLRDVEVQARAILDLGDLALDAPAIVRGVVRAAGGAPEPGAWLSWEPFDPYFRHVFVDPYWDRVKADETGAFELPVWVHGPVWVYAQGGPFMVAPEGVPHAGEPFPMGRSGHVEYRPGDGAVTLVTGSRR
jgi:RNA polymerase sigma-70 factor (ECF subfamily)